ncbi:uncharacterized protein LOC114165600 [Vigna unguiculata]|uniref:uncharacterized protein LOC114165600 n=1 Tax=Vigna unguiculata TaxID=3917 RepID=UPI001016EB01|nr:uncharacterized protein LOC114165600 [Vigna unguiculata]
MAGECGFNEKARLRTFCQTKWIGQMNGIILDRHRERIQGLSVVGLDVGFDKTVCGVVGGLLQDKIVTVETIIEIIQSLIWAVERLSLGGPELQLIFPRILAWPEVHFKSRRIEKLFQESKICVEWRLREEDKQNIMIREALQLGDEAKSEKSHVDIKLASTKVLLQRLRTHRTRLRMMKDEMTLMREEISLRCHSGIDKGVQHGQGNDGDEVEVDVGERDTDEQLPADDGNVVEGSSGGDVGSGLDMNRASHGGISDGVEPLQAIVPYVPQQPRMTQFKVDYMKLYSSITVFGVPNRVVCNINGQILGTNECWGFGPRKKVDNMTHVLTDSRRMIVKRRQWTLRDYAAYFRAGLIVLEDILSADFLFAPIVNDDHWWCYVVNCKEKKLYVLDSIGHSNKSRRRIDNAVAHNMGLLFGMLMKCSELECPKFEVHCDITPIQPNLYDCGIIVLQMMELWDDEKKFDGNSMPNYTNEQLQLIRQQYIWRWILDVDNIYRQEVLQYYNALL